VAAAGDEKIGGLDVAMDDALGVRGVQRVGDFDADVEQAVHFEGTAVHGVLQRGAVEKFHGDEGFAVFFADIVDGADAGMVQRGGGLRFALEASEGLLVARNFGGKKFQRDEAVQARVFRFVNHAHAAAAEAFYDTVMGDCLADQRRVVTHVRAILVWSRVQVNGAGVGVVLQFVCWDSRSFFFAGVAVGMLY